MTEDNVIYAEFGNEREWRKTREKTTEGLVTIGSLYGDSEQLMKAKAEVVMRVLRGIVEDVPKVSFRFQIPSDMPIDLVAGIEEAVKGAALKGIEVAMSHSVACLMESIYDLCTSKLKEGS